MNYNNIVKTFTNTTSKKTRLSLCRHSFDEITDHLLRNELWYGFILVDIITQFERTCPYGPVPTMGVYIDDMRNMPVMCINPEFLAWMHLNCENTIYEKDDGIIDIYYKNQKQSLLARSEIVKHELLHVILKHNKRVRLMKDVQKALVCADIEANNYLDISVLNFPDDMKPHTYEMYGLPHGMTLEWYYDNFPEQKNLKGKKQPAPPTDMFPDAETEHHVDQMILKATKIVSKAMGSIPKDVLERVLSLRESDINWKDRLHVFCELSYNQEVQQSFRRPNKRIKDLYPSRRRMPIPRVVACVDTSASITKEELFDFHSEIKAISNSYGGMTVIQSDAKVQKVQECEVDDIEDIIWKGRGGTNFQPALDFCYKNGIQNMVYMTDGFAPPPTNYYGINVLWVFPNKRDSKTKHLIGEKVFIDDKATLR